MNRKLALLLLSVVMLPSPLLAQGRSGAYSSQIWDYVFEGKQSIRYGNWAGPGWWGGSTDDNRVGMLAPIDSLDAIAQKHDLGYKVAEELGAGRPLYIAYYKALADATCAREAAALSKTPAEWPHPPTDNNYALAKKLRSRLAIGFGDVVQNINAAKGALRGRWNKSDEEEIEGMVSKESFAAKVDAELTSWNKQYAKWQKEKAAKVKKNWGGRWHLASQYISGALDLTQSGTNVSGRYENGKLYGQVNGTVTGNTLVGKWTDPNSGNSGPFKWTIDANGRSFSGSFSWQGNSYAWTGSR